MNKDRRERLETLKKALDELGEQLEVIKDEEQAFFDNMPENIQQGEKGDQTQDAINSMEDALDTLRETISHLEEASI